MKVIVILLLVVASLGMTAVLGKTASAEKWNQFKKKYNKSYSNDEEEQRRMQIFQTNSEFVERHMTEYADGRHTFTVAINKFSDLTTEEWSTLYNRFSMEKKPAVTGPQRPWRRRQHVSAAYPADDTVDWRQRGAVTPVKDQTPACGSCWAFTTTGAVEGAWVVAGYSLVSLSEQQLIDCSRDYGNVGCKGGRMENAYQYLLDNEGIMSEKDYPYRAVDNVTCVDDISLFVAHIDGWSSVRPAGDEQALRDAVGEAPVATAIDSSHPSMQHYSSGVYNEPACSSSALDHAVLIVGYGDGYWLVKNSWGTDWGMDGYIKMTRDGSNQCGIATDPSQPIVVG